MGLHDDANAQRPCLVDGGLSGIMGRAGILGIIVAFIWLIGGLVYASVNHGAPNFEGLLLFSWCSFMLWGMARCLALLASIERNTRRTE